MKRFYLLLTGIVLLSSFTLLSEIDDVVSAIKNGNAAQIARSFDDKVQLTMPDKSNSYSKADAQAVVKAFFAANPVTGFTVIHQGANDDGSAYCIGTLQTKNGNYRTTIFMKQKGNSKVLQELKFESQ
jgi:1,4-dihydroxy-2-naphthoyl-CoA synthase